VNYSLKPIDGLLQATKVKLLKEKVVKIKNEISLSKSNELVFTSGNSNKSNHKISRDYLLSELDQIAASLTIDRAKYYVRRLIKSITVTRVRPGSEINLNRWKQYPDILTDSLWVMDRRDRSGAHHAGYWGNFIPQIPSQMMQRYTKKGEWVLDTFGGMGTSLIEGRRLGRNVIGVELQAKVISLGKKNLTKEANPYKVTTDYVLGNSAENELAPVLRKYKTPSVQLVIMHPPYFDIIKFSKDKSDLSNAKSNEDFLDKMEAVTNNAAKVLDKGRHLILVIGDKYAGSEWVPLGFQTMERVKRVGFALKSIIVKNIDQTAGKRGEEELWRYRALAGGYYVFKHEYIFVFKKK
jgi:DNA modification methylase